MLAQFDIMQHLYTNFSLEKYESYLDEMVPHTTISKSLFLKGMFVSVFLDVVWSFGVVNI
jgi:hypothetical protein